LRSASLNVAAAAAASGATAILPTNDYDVFDLTGGFTFSDKWLLRYGIDNVFDKSPEVIDATPWSKGSATNGNFYDVLGRTAYVGASMRF